MAKFKATLASRAISKAVNSALNAELPRLSREVKEVVDDQIELAFDIANSPEVDSMINGRSIGSLKAQLGLTNSREKVNLMKRSILSNVKVKRVPSAGRRLARVNVDFEPDTREMASESWAFQENNGRNGPPRLPWFGWLALAGTTTQVLGWSPYDAKGTPGARYSRSNTGVIMRKGGARSWSVPTQFAGTSSNNFVTRALNKRLISIRRQTDLALRNYLNRIRRRVR